MYRVVWCVLVMVVVCGGRGESGGKGVVMVVVCVGCGESGGNGVVMVVVCVVVVKVVVVECW